MKKHQGLRTLAWLRSEGNSDPNDSYWLYPGHALDAWLEVDSRRLAELEVLWPERSQVKELVARARAKGVHVRKVPASAGVRDDEFAQYGARAKMRAFPYKALPEVLESGAGESGAALLVILDHVLDPRNLGAAIRSALAAGASGLVIPFDRAAQVTAAVEVAAAGACAYLPIARVVNLARTLYAIQEAGYWTVALDPRGGESLFATALPQRLAVVVGGEQGVSRLLRERVDQLLKIPTDPRVESLNLAVAVSVACLWWFKDHISRP